MRTLSLEVSGKAAFWCKFLLKRPKNLFSELNKFQRKTVKRLQITLTTEPSVSWRRSPQLLLFQKMTLSMKLLYVLLIKKSRLVNPSFVKVVTTDLTSEQNPMRQNSLVLIQIEKILALFSSIWGKSSSLEASRIFVSGEAMLVISSIPIPSILSGSNFSKTKPLEK